MKNYLKFSVFTFCLLLIVSCSNDDDTELITPPTNGDVTYSNTVKAIIDNNCLNCHVNPPINGAPMSLITYSNVKDAVQNRNLIGRIENGTMPPNGSLTSTQIQAIKNWQADGLVE